MKFTQAQLDAMTDRTLEDLRYIVIHHTAAIDMDEDIVDISREEIADQDFIAVGYNFVVHGNGVIQVGRPITKVPAANLGLNMPSVAISLEGHFHPPDSGYNGEHPTAAQLKAVVKIVNEWVKPKARNIKYLIGHRDVAVLIAMPSDATACPGDLLYAKLDGLRNLTHLGYPT